jgi:hypothetical protein
MKSDNLNDLEKALASGKLLHLKDGVLISYRDQKLDEISRKQVEAHLELCLTCERRLLMFQQERAAIDNPGENTPEDKSRIRRALQSAEAQNLLGSKLTHSSIASTLKDVLIDSVRDAVLNWQDYFRKLAPVRGAHRSGVKLWEWKAKDGVVEGYARLESNGDLTIHLSSNNVGFEGARLKIRVGMLTQETTLSRFSDSEVRADVLIPRRNRPRDLTDISIEVI